VNARSVRDGWAGGVGRPDRSLRRLLGRVLPGAAVGLALIVAAWILWPRTEPATSATPTTSVEVVDPGGSSAPPDPAPMPTSAPAPAETTSPVTTMPSEGTGGGPLPAPEGGASVLEFARTHGLVLLQPRALPPNWRNDGAEIVPGDSTPEGCDQAGIYWLDAVDADFGFLDTYQFPARCAAPRPDNAEPFVAGMHVGWIAPDNRAGWQVEMVVGSTLVQIYSDLLPDDLRGVLANLVPYDPESAPEATFTLSPR